MEMKDVCPECENVLPTFKEHKKWNMPGDVNKSIVKNVLRWKSILPTDIINSFETNCVLLYFSSGDAYGFCPSPKFFVKQFNNVFTNNRDEMKQKKDIRIGFD